MFFLFLQLGTNSEKAQKNMQKSLWAVLCKYSKKASVFSWLAT